jgi:hypothetical protein
VNEGLEEPKTEEALPELATQEASVATPAAEASGPFWLRWAYTLEFLLAWMAILTLWSEVGGQGHLDLLPWYTKLACVVGWAVCWVGFTASIVEQKKFWTGRTIRWFTGVLLVAIAMAGITYYYHLHEEPDDGSDDTTANSVSTMAPGRPFYDASDRTKR